MKVWNIKVCKYASVKSKSEKVWSIKVKTSWLMVNKQIAMLKSIEIWSHWYKKSETLLVYKYASMKVCKYNIQKWEPMRY